PGSESQISAGAGGNIWGLTSDTRIWSYTSDNSNSPWAQFSGTFDSISVGRANNVWGVFKGEIWRCTNGGSGAAPWVQLHGPTGVNLSQTVWGVSA
ncbi:hypothetical protein R3P38DRAFT_2375054, partial [Favolaschia claudopus]